MRAATYTRFGPPEVLSVTDIGKPVPADGEVLVEVHATTVTSAEAAMRRGRPLWGRVIIGLFRPRRRMRVLGIEVAGVVHAVGPNVTRFRVGDEVFGFAGFAIGANAEYFRMREQGSLALKPKGTTFEQAAAAVDGSTTALFFLRDKAELREGERVLVIGASGSIGTYAVQLARHFGAEVTGVCSTRNVELVRTLGAHDVFDYTREDFTQSGRQWDVVFDTVGKSSFSKCRRVLAPGGRFLPTTGLFNYALTWWTSIFGDVRVLAGMSVDKRESLAFVRDLIESGELQVVIDRRYSLDDIVEAHRYVDSGRKRGNVVVAVR